MTVPFFDLKEQNQALKHEILAAIERTLDASAFILGREVEAFEEAFAAYCRCRHAIAVNSGTSALHLALLAAGVHPGDEVITVPYSFVATVAAIEYCQAKPVLVDIDLATFTMDPTQLEAAITPRTRAILPVHLFGRIAAMEPILDIASRYGIPVIEDAAQAHGAELDGKRAGSIGLAGCFSFYPAKNLGAYGEGGIVTTNNGDVADTIRSLRNWGEQKRYHSVRKGFNYRMEGLQGAILATKLHYLDRWTEARRAHAALYDRLLEGSVVERPPVSPGSRHVYHIYAIRTAGRDALRAALAEAGVESRIHYPQPIHLMGPYQGLGYRESSLPQAERASREEISLPMFPELRPESIEYVSSVIRNFI